MPGAIKSAAVTVAEARTCDVVADRMVRVDGGCAVVSACNFLAAGGRDGGVSHVSEKRTRWVRVQNGPQCWKGAGSGRRPLLAGMHVK